MRFSSSPTFAAFLLPFLALAHFELNSPPSRPINEDALAEYPCGGQNTQGERSQFPLAGGPIQLDMGHDHSLVQVNLAVGNVAVDGNAFNVNLLPLVQQEGLGDFCLGAVMIPSSLNLRDGDNATLQVITNGDPQGGLYNCADITLSASATPGDCTNDTNVRAEAYSGNLKNANGTDSAIATTSGSAAAASPTGSSSAGALGVGMGMVGGIVGLMLAGSLV